MKRMVVVLCALVSAAVSAQEIGTELPGDPPGRAPTRYDNTPPAQGEGQQAQSSQAAAGSAAQTGVPGPKGGTFGISSGFTGSGVPGAIGGTVPAFGLRYLATDSLALRFDVGAGLGFGNTFLFGFGLGFGIESYMGSADKPLRPFIGAGIDLGMPLSREVGNLSLAIEAGGGAEYWFSDHFSLQGRLMVGLPIADLEDADQLTLATFTPGLRANFYF